MRGKRRSKGVKRARRVLAPGHGWTWPARYERPEDGLRRTIEYREGA